MFYRKQELLTLREQLGSPPVFDGSVLLIFLAFCVVLFFFVGLNHVPCVPNVASFSGLSILDCPYGFLYCSLGMSYKIGLTVYALLNLMFCSIYSYATAYCVFICGMLD